MTAESDATTPEAPQVQAEPEPAPEAVDTRKKTVPNEPDFPFYKGEHLRFQNADIFKRTGATLIGSVLEIGKGTKKRGCGRAERQP